MCVLLSLLLGSSDDSKNDVDNYFGHEDYYDDHWADFKDEEEARKYYYDHGGI